MALRIKFILFSVCLIFATQAYSNSNVVVLGDSHLSCTAYAQNLHSCLRKANYNTTLLARGSAAPSHWRTGRTKGLQRLCGYGVEGERIGPSSTQNSWKATDAIRIQKAGTVVLNLGDNLLGCAKQRNSACVKSQFNDLIKNIRETNPNINCVLVTPTLPSKAGGGAYGKTKAHAEFLRKYIAESAKENNCSYIDGIDILRDRSNGNNLSGGDGVHLNSTNYGILGDRVCKKTLELIKTDSSTGRGTVERVSQ